MRDVGNGLGADRVISDQERGELGDLSELRANAGGIGSGTSGSDTGGSQGPGGMLCNPRQGLGEFERF